MWRYMFTPRGIADHPEVARWAAAVVPSPDTHVVFIQHQCRSRYRAMVQELMRHVRVDSYGACLHNKDKPWPPAAGRVSQHEYLQKLAILSRYSWAISFENAAEEDWVTERLYHALLARAIPIYDGAPNVRAFTPHADAVLHVRDFMHNGTMADVGAYVNALNAPGNEAERAARHHDPWRTRDRAMWDNGAGFAGEDGAERSSGMCRVCHAVAQLREAQRAGLYQSAHHDSGDHPLLQGQHGGPREGVWGRG